MCQSKPSKFFIKLYTDLNTLLFKHATHRKTESLRAAFPSKLDNTANNNSISNTQNAEFSIKQQVLLHFSQCYNFAYTHLYNLHQKSVPLLQPNFTSLFRSFFFTKSSLQSPLTLQFCAFSFLPTTIPTVYTIKYFPYYSHSANSGCAQ